MNEYERIGLYAKQTNTVTGGRQSVHAFSSVPCSKGT